jgi:DNA-binding GntR family transcriptional regulator
VTSAAQPVSPVSGVTRRDAVLSELRDAILAGRIQPGDRLKEVQLARELGVSRPTLREALYQLIHEGLLVQEDYKGITVAGIEESMISDIAVVRAALETIAACQIGADPTGAQQQALHRAWLDYDAAAASGDQVRENEAHLELHRTIWVTSQNTMLQRIWPIVSAPVNLALSTDVVAHHDPDRNRRMHRELVEAIATGNHGEIEAVVREHIQVSAADLLIILRQREHQRNEQGLGQ